jgi:hypothetical protein
MLRTHGVRSRLVRHPTRLSRALLAEGSRRCGRFGHGRRALDSPGPRIESHATFACVRGEGLTETLERPLSGGDTYEWLPLHMPTEPPGSSVPGSPPCADQAGLPASPISSERLVAPQRLQVHTV